jgi:hypothetical protein
MVEGKIVSDTKGDYDCIGTPKPVKIESDSEEEYIKIDEDIDSKEKEEEKKKSKGDKKEKEKKTDESLKGLNKKILKKLLNANIENMDLALNLTESDLKNLELSKKEQKILEDFVRKYLNSKEK